MCTLGQSSLVFAGCTWLRLLDGSGSGWFAMFSGLTAKLLITGMTLAVGKPVGQQQQPLPVTRHTTS